MGNETAHASKHFLTTSFGRVSQADNILSIQRLRREGAFIRPAEVTTSCSVSGIQSSYAIWHRSLKVVFHETSGAWIYFVQPPGTKAESTPACRRPSYTPFVSRYAYLRAVYLLNASLRYACSCYACSRYIYLRYAYLRCAFSRYVFTRYDLYDA